MTKDNEKRVILIIPAYNEEKNILKVYESIISFNRIKNTIYDVIVINDGSTDNTGLICENNNIPFINLIDNLGIGGAVQTGYKYALKNKYDIAIQFDGDGQHDVNYVENLIQPIIDNQADIVIGSRFIDKNSSEFKSTFLRRVGIKIISFFVRLFSGKKLLDTTSGFRACNQKIIKMFAKNYPTEYPEPITNMFLLKNKFKVKEIPVKMNERTAGISSIRTWKNFYYMVNVILSIIIVGIRKE